tara:strand:+ start:28237 stop:29481 length:1245 start_codon:yes stop_codon:yes gene_type:complete
MKKYLVFWLLAMLFTISCKQKSEKPANTPISALESSVQRLNNPTEPQSHLPRLFSNGEQLYMSWMTQKKDTSYLNFSVFDGANWLEAETITQGNDWFINWADFPAIAINKRGDILTSFLEKSDTATYTYDVKLNLYNAETRTWKKDFILHNDGTKSEHGFVSMRPYAGNSFMVTWLDGRETAGKEHAEGQMTLRGALVFEDGTIDYDTLLDERVCDCCQTTTAIGANDQIIVAYRDRSEEEVRDISVTDWTKEAGWSQPRTIGNDNWKIAGCPVNGPSIDAKGDHVAVAWFTVAKGEGNVNVAFSKDGAKTFGMVSTLDKGSATGRVALQILSETEALVLWMEPKDEKEVLVLAKVNSAGKKISEVIISETSPERVSGFPQLEVLNDIAFIAWTDVEGENKSIKTAKIALEHLN